MKGKTPQDEPEEIKKQQAYLYALKQRHPDVFDDPDFDPPMIFNEEDIDGFADRVANDFRLRRRYYKPSDEYVIKPLQKEDDLDKTQKKIQKEEKTMALRFNPVDFDTVARLDSGTKLRSGTGVLNTEFINALHVHGVDRKNNTRFVLPFIEAQKIGVNGAAAGNLVLGTADLVLANMPKSDLKNPRVKRLEEYFAKEHQEKLTLDIEQLLKESKDIELDALASGAPNREASLLSAVNIMRNVEKIISNSEMLYASMTSNFAEERLWAANKMISVLRDATNSYMNTMLFETYAPEKLARIAKANEERARETLQSASRQADQWIHRPNDVFGVWLFSSIFPPAATLVILPILVPLIISILSNVRAVSAKEQSTNEQHIYANHRARVSAQVYIGQLVNAEIVSMITAGKNKVEILDAMDKKIQTEYSKLYQDVEARFKNFYYKFPSDHHINFSSGEFDRYFGMLQEITAPLNEQIKNVTAGMNRIEVNTLNDSMHHFKFGIANGTLEVLERQQDPIALKLLSERFGIRENSLSEAGKAIFEENARKEYRFRTGLELQRQLREHHTNLFTELREKTSLNSAVNLNDIYSKFDADFLKQMQRNGLEYAHWRNGSETYVGRQAAIDPMTVNATFTGLQELFNGQEWTSLSQNDLKMKILDPFISDAFAKILPNESWRFLDLISMEQNNIANNDTNSLVIRELGCLFNGLSKFISEKSLSSDFTDSILGIKIAEMMQTMINPKLQVTEHLAETLHKTFINEFFQSHHKKIRLPGANTFLDVEIPSARTLLLNPGKWYNESRNEEEKVIRGIIIKEYQSFLQENAGENLAFNYKTLVKIADVANCIANKVGFQETVSFPEFEKSVYQHFSKTQKDILHTIYQNVQQEFPSCVLPEEKIFYTDMNQWYIEEKNEELRKEKLKVIQQVKEKIIEFDKLHHSEFVREMKQSIQKIGQIDFTKLSFEELETYKHMLLEHRFVTPLKTLDEEKLNNMSFVFQQLANDTVLEHTAGQGLLSLVLDPAEAGDMKLRETAKLLADIERAEKSPVMKKILNRFSKDDITKSDDMGIGFDR